MVFSTNQNRQLYVASAVATSTPASEGEILLKSFTEGNNTKFYFQHYGKGGLVRSDIIDLSKVTYAKLTDRTALQRALKTCTISLSSDVNGGEPISGQDYIVRIVIYNYIGIGDDNVYIKEGMVHATSSMDASSFYEKLAESFTINFSREVAQLFTFESTDSGVTITEVEQPWHLGTMPSRPVYFKVFVVPITYEDDDYTIWATTNDDGYIEITDSDTYITDGKKIADLEYFCMGERADQYRNVGWPNVVPTEYMVDSSEEYDVLDIHYAFTDSGVNVQKSEKDITIVASDASVLTELQTSLEALGITVETVTKSTSTTTE